MTLLLSQENKRLADRVRELEVANAEFQFFVATLKQRIDQFCEGAALLDYALLDIIRNASRDPGKAKPLRIHDHTEMYREAMGLLALATGSSYEECHDGRSCP